MSLERKAKYLLAFGIVNFVLYFVIQGVVTQHEYDFMTAFDLAGIYMDIPQYSPGHSCDYVFISAN